MALSREDEQRLSDAVLRVDPGATGELTRQQLENLFEVLGITGIPEDRRSVLIDGISCHGAIKVTYNICTTFYTVWTSKNKLGIARVCFRGIISAKKDVNTITFTELLLIADAVSSEKSRDQLTNDAAGRENFTFAETAKVVLDFDLPETAEVYDGIVAKKSCLIV